MMVHYEVDSDIALSKHADQIAQAVKQSIGRSTLKLLNKVKREKLSGQILNVRTGRLRRSITQKIIESSDAYSGIVGTNVEYAAGHEYGFKGSVNVREHLRTVKQAWGKSIQPKKVLIKAHSRQVDLPEKSFLRSALQDMRTEIKADLQMSIGRSVS